MEDDTRCVQSVYLPTPIIREEKLKQYPKIADILKPIFEALDLQTLQTLNGRVQVGGEPANAVAADFLSSRASSSKVMGPLVALMTIGNR